jgi:photosystem II stability/assembly factor-like uncharacterized protein
VSVTRRGGAHAVAVAGPTTVYATITERDRWSLWKSVDRGASWRRIARNAIPSGDGPLALAVGASDPDTVYVARGSGLATSTDGGATWHHADPAGTQITAIAVHPRLADTVYAGTTAGLFTSTNAGQTWHRMGDDLAQAHVTAVATDPEQGGRLYAATENEIFWSGNNGASWNRFDTKKIPPRTFNDLTATPDGMIYAGSFNGGGVVHLRTTAQAPRR